VRLGSGPGRRASTGNDAPCHISLVAIVTADEFVMSRFDVADNQRPPRPSRALPTVIPLPNVTEHPEPGGVKLDDANVLCRGVVRVEPPTQELVELLGSLDVGHGG